MRNTTDRELLPSNTFTPHHHQFFSLLITAWGLSWPSSLAWSWEIIEILWPDGSVFQEARIVWYFSEGGICLQGQYIFLNRSICCFVDATIFVSLYIGKYFLPQRHYPSPEYVRVKKRRQEKGNGKWQMETEERKKKRTAMTYINSYTLYLLTDNWKLKGEILEYLTEDMMKQMW